LVVAITALRIGAVDLAVADIFGANMLDIAVIFPVDLAQGQGFVLPSVSSGHLIAASVAVTMTIFVMAGLRFRRSRKLFGVASWYTPLLIALYVFGSYALFNSGTGL
jgi:cation:H+ antiporter